MRKKHEELYQKKINFHFSLLFTHSLKMEDEVFCLFNTQIIFQFKMN